MLKRCKQQAVLRRGMASPALIGFGPSQVMKSIRVCLQSLPNQKSSCCLATIPHTHGAPVGRGHVEEAVAGAAIGNDVHRIQRVQPRRTGLQRHPAHERNQITAELPRDTGGCCSSTWPPARVSTRSLQAGKFQAARPASLPFRVSPQFPSGTTHHSFMRSGTGS